MIIPGFSNYSITEDGVVTEIATGRVLRHNITNVKPDYLYKTVFLADDSGRRKRVSVIKLLAVTYLGLPDRPSIARTIDGDSTNTVLSNIEWVACNSHAYIHSRGTARKRKRACYDDNSIALVYETLTELDEPISVLALSRMLDLPYSTVRYSMYALIEQGKVHRVESGVEVLK